jgi:hypothetical protein
MPTQAERTGICRRGSGHAASTTWRQSASRRYGPRSRQAKCQCLDLVFEYERYSAARSVRRASRRSHGRGGRELRTISTRRRATCAPAATRMWRSPPRSASQGAPSHYGRATCRGSAALASRRPASATPRACRATGKPRARAARPGDKRSAQRPQSGSARCPTGSFSSLERSRTGAKEPRTSFIVAAIELSSSTATQA